MAETSLFEQVVDVVRSVAKLDPELPVQADSRLIEDLGVDSLDLVGVFLQLQDDFEIVVAEEDVPRLVTLGDLTQYVSERRAAAAA